MANEFSRHVSEFGYEHAGKLAKLIDLLVHVNLYVCMIVSVDLLMVDSDSCEAAGTCCGNLKVSRSGFCTL